MIARMGAAMEGIRPFMLVQDTFAESAAIFMAKERRNRLPSMLRARRRLLEIMTSD